MPDLYGEGASLLQASGNQAANIAQTRQATTDTTVKAGEAAGAQVGETQRQISAQQATMALEKMKASEKMQGKVLTITPQIALGLAKNTGDREWMQAVGQDMRSDVLLGLYTHGMSLQQAKKAPKVTQIYDGNGKIRHAVVYTDEQGNIQQLMLDEGIAPEALNKGKGGGAKKTGAAKDDTFKKQKEFNRAYEKLRSVYDDPMKAQETKIANPDKYNQDLQWLKDNQDQYDQNVRAMGKAGSPSPAAGVGGSSAVPDNAPFNADAFIRDALGQ